MTVSTLWQIMSLIFEAIQSKDLEKVKEVVATGIDLNTARSSDGLKVIHVAALSPNIAILEHLLKQVS